VAERGEEAQASGAVSAAPDVFISYASEDAAVATALVEALERHKIVCWIAPRDVRPGALYADAIVRAINAARSFVLVLSARSIASSHVGKEIERASSKKRPVIAVRIDAAPLTPALEYFLSESQWIDAPEGHFEPAFERLVDAIREPAATAAGTAGAAPVRQSAAPHKRLLLLAGIALVAVGLAALLADRLWLGRRVGADKAAAPLANVAVDKSIAVLPFADMSERRDQEYFADGIAEEVLDRLTKVPGLKVVGRASSFQFKGSSADPASVGAALGVAYLLEGSVRRDAGRVRVAAQLVDAQTGSQRWSDRFDADLTDMLQVQDTIAVELARALQITVEVDTTAHSAIKSADALDAYLRGRQALDRVSREGCDSAVAYFQKALALDPEFAPAAIGLARTYAFMGSTAWLPTMVAFERARDAAKLAQRLDPKSPSAHVTMALIHVGYDWDWAGAQRELQQAFALGPRDSFGARTASRLAAALGRWDEARQFATEAIALDPLDADAIGAPGYEIYLRTGNAAAAEQSFRHALQIAPGWGAGHYFLGMALMLQGRRDDALAEFRKETLDDGQLEGSAMVHFAAGRKAESDARLDEAIRHNGTTWASAIARVYAFRGETDRALEWLERAYRNRDEDLYFIKGDPVFRTIEGDPRYKAFLRKMNLLD
jgi:TolB-like protein